MSGRLVFDLSDDNSLEELKKQIELESDDRWKKGKESDDDLNQQWLFGYYTACLDIVRGINQVKKLRQSET